LNCYSAHKKCVNTQFNSNKMLYIFNTFILKQAISKKVYICFSVTAFAIRSLQNIINTKI